MCNDLLVSDVHIYTFNNVILACDKEKNEKYLSVKEIIKSVSKKFVYIICTNIMQDVSELAESGYVILCETWHSVFSLFNTHASILRHIINIDLFIYI